MIEPAHGILIHGPPGSGKSKLAEAIAGTLNIPLFIISAPEIISGMSGESEQKIRELFKSAKETAPSLILIDEIDSIASKREFSQRDMERRVIAQLTSSMDHINDDFLKGGSLSIVIGTTSQPDSLDPSLRRAGRFDHEIKIPIPSEFDRVDILMKLSSNFSISNDVDFSEIAKCCPGYVAADLFSLFRSASNFALDRVFTNSVHDLSETITCLKIDHSDFLNALKGFQPSSKREGYITIPDISWEDIGALESVREELSFAVVEPIKNRSLFESFGLFSPCGVLLWGPPGCGKTMLAKAIANESHSNFISVKGPELVNKFVGESERAIRNLFDRARSSSPCIIFFDEIDSICPKRNEINENSSSRIVNQLLTEMDGIEGRKDVYIIAATNRPDMIDPAIIRPGRLDKLVYINLPTAEERYAILAAISRNMPINPDADLKEVAFDTRCNRFSGADLSSLIREAAIYAIKEYSLDPLLNAAKKIMRRHIEMAFSKVSASVSESELYRFELMNAKIKLN